jgi:prepilin-type processing-associated H-X9-DG protein
LIGAFGYFVVWRSRQALEKRAACQANLKYLYGSASLGMDVLNVFPKSLQGAAGATERPGMFLCPATGHVAGDPNHVELWADYAYVGGVPEVPGARCVLAGCPPELHGGDGANVVFIDGSVVWYPLDQFVKLTNTPSLLWGTDDAAFISGMSRTTQVFYPKR